MSLVKLPVFKNLVPSSHGKRRLKPELTTDMISSPLGDFRHTMHVGRGGDVFGDTSFLSDHGGEKSREGGRSNPLVRALRNARKSAMRNGSQEVSPPPVVSPIIKNAVSLPHLLETKNGSVERLNFKTVMSCPGVVDGSYGLESGFCTLPRWSRLEKAKEASAQVGLTTPEPDPELPRTDSLLSFSLDLGPSLMSEVLAVLGRESMAGKECPSPDAAVSAGSKDSPSPSATRCHGLEAPLGVVVREFSREPSLDGLRRREHPAPDEARALTGGQAARHGAERACAEGPQGPSQDGGRDKVPLARSRHIFTTAERGPSQRWGSLHCEEEGARRQGSWRSSRQRVPADGEEAELGHRERHWESSVPATEATGFNPLKAEAFAFADEDEEIRV